MTMQQTRRWYGTVTRMEDRVSNTFSQVASFTAETSTSVQDRISIYQGRHMRQAIFSKWSTFTDYLEKFDRLASLSPTTYDIADNQSKHVVVCRLSLRPGYFIVPVRVLHPSPLDNIMRVLVFECLLSNQTLSLISLSSMRTYTECGIDLIPHS